MAATNKGRTVPERDATLAQHSFFLRDELTLGSGRVNIAPRISSVFDFAV